ncbi:MAG: hypothetical protein IJY33_01675 [Oscillospiraceae bacterium]|nr:hypothetical protein [Oscillospiraceae bacterium]
MQQVAIALCWIAFALFILQSKCKKRRRLLTVLFLVAAALAVLAIALWGVFRNFR